MPVFGVLGFIALGVLALLRGKTPRLLMALGAALASSAGVFLMSVQRSIGHYCPYCMAADIACLAVLGFAIWRFLGRWDPPKVRGAA